MKSKREKLILKKLQDTKSHCHFKKAFFPKDWTCLNIYAFARELHKELKKEKL